MIFKQAFDPLEKHEKVLKEEMIRNGRKWGCLTWCHSIVYDHVRIFILTLFVVFSTSTPLQSQWFMHDTSYISYISYWSTVHGDGDQLLGAKIVSSHAASPSLRLTGMRCERLGPFRVDPRNPLVICGSSSPHWSGCSWLLAMDRPYDDRLSRNLGRKWRNRKRF